MPRDLVYKRIVLKLSGETLGVPGKGVEVGKLQAVAREIAAVRKLGVQVGVVVGGGNIWRKRNQGRGLDPVAADFMGMLATVMNALALAQALRALKLTVAVQSPIAADVPLVGKLNPRAARRVLGRGGVVVFPGSTGRPYLTSDTAAAMRARDIAAEVIVKLSQVDGVYTADPNKVRSAKKYRTLTMAAALRCRLGVMDKEAFQICRKAKIPIIVCRWGRGVVGGVVRGEQVGTLVTP